MTNTPSAGSLRLRYLVPPVLWALLIFVVSSIPGNELQAPDIFQFDKLAHLGVYFVLALLVYRALRVKELFPRLHSHATSVTMLLIALYGASDEFHQVFVPGRSVDLFDWLADALGGVLCALVVVLLTRRHSRKTAAGA